MNKKYLLAQDTQVKLISMIPSWRVRIYKQLNNKYNVGREILYEDTIDGDITTITQEIDIEQATGVNVEINELLIPVISDFTNINYNPIIDNRNMREIIDNYIELCEEELLYMYDTNTFINKEYSGLSGYIYDFVRTKKITISSVYDTSLKNIFYNTLFKLVGIDSNVFYELYKDYVDTYNRRLYNVSNGEKGYIYTNKCYIEFIISYNTKSYLEYQTLIRRKKSVNFLYMLQQLTGVLIRLNGATKTINNYSESRYTIRIKTKQVEIEPEFNEDGDIIGYHKSSDIEDKVIDFIDDKILILNN